MLERRLMTPRSSELNSLLGTCVSIFAESQQRVGDNDLERNESQLEQVGNSDLSCMHQFEILFSPQLLWPCFSGQHFLPKRNGSK